LFCGGRLDADKWDDAQIGHYMGIGTQFFIFYFKCSSLIWSCFYM
jgi:hypothetical protein